MGAHLFYKLENQTEATAVMDYICDVSETAKKLIEIKEGVSFGERADIDWAIEHKREDMIPFLQKRIGAGDIKTSGGLSYEAVAKGFSEEYILELYTQMFEELNKRFAIKYYAGSCSFSIDEDYFSISQMKRITNNGLLLSGKSSSTESTVRKYNELLELLQEPELFDVAILKANDQIMIDEKWYAVIPDRYNAQELNISMNYRSVLVKNIASKITGYKKYIPKCTYSGSSADIESYIIDNGTLIFVEIIGQEQYVKAITSVLMQGRTKLDNQNLFLAGNFCEVHKAGNRRKMIDLGNGVSHAIVYHSPSIVEAGFFVLIGRNKEELLTQFSQWLEKSQPLPYPKELTKNIFDKMEQNDLIKSMKAYQIEALKIQPEILENEFQLLQDLIIDVCKENSAIAIDAKPMKQKAPLPKSPLLTQAQVQKIYDTLEAMPKTYELDGMKIKPVGLKLFTSGFTWYVVEADKGSDSDELSGLHPQAFGYVKNECDEWCSEWGYINIEEVISVGAEMDLCATCWVLKRYSANSL